MSRLFRKTFVFAADGNERLQALATATRMPSEADVVRLSLSVLGDIVKHMQSGGSVSFVSADGKKTKSYSPLLASAEEVTETDTGGARVLPMKAKRGRPPRAAEESPRDDRAPAAEEPRVGGSSI